MKTSQGKLAVLAFALLLAVILFVPMRYGQEDSLLLKPGELHMSVGDSYKLVCSLSSEDVSQRLRFSTSDVRVARIALDGTVYAAGSGTAVIRAEASGGASAETLVKVAGVPMTQLELNVDQLSIDKGEYSGLRATFNSDATDQRLRWLSSNENIVRVDSSGRVEGVGGGNAYVSVIASNGMTATARVHVRVAGTAVHISPNHMTLGVGAQVPLNVSYLPLDCTDSVRRWISSNPTVLAMTETGAVVARNPGSAYVTVVTADGLTSGMKVTVEPAPKQIQLDPTRATLERGDTLQMQLMFLEEDGSVESDMRHLVSWSSTDPSVASVDANGLVTALKSGTCRIDASSDGMVASCRLNVQVNIHTITLDRSEVYLLREETGEPIQLRTEYYPADSDLNTIIYTSDNEQVATVTQEGLVEMTGGYGTAVITASAESGARAEFTVNVVTQLPGQEEPQEDEPADEGEPEAWDGQGADGGFPSDEFPSDDGGAASIWGEPGSADGEAPVYEGEDMYGDEAPVYEGEDMYGDEAPMYEGEDMYGDEAPVYEGEDMYGDESFGGGGEAGVAQEPTPQIVVTPVPNVTQEPFNMPVADVTVDPAARDVWN